MYVCMYVCICFNCLIQAKINNNLVCLMEINNVSMWDKVDLGEDNIFLIPELNAVDETVSAFVFSFGSVMLV